MRVLVDYRSALRGRSGVGEYTHGMVGALLALGASSPNTGLDVTLFSSSWKDRLTVPRDLENARRIDLRVPVSALNFAWHRLNWPPAELLTRQAFDVVHSLHPLLLPARRAAQVITIHDLNFLEHPERTRAEIRRDYPVLARAHAQRADRIIAVSKFTAGEVQSRLGVPADRITVCSPGAPEWRPRPQPPAKGYILFFGTLEPRKNVGKLLDAYERLLMDPPSSGKAPELVLAGAAPPEAQPWLDRIARPPLAGRVRHLGYVEPGDRRSVYAGASVLVQPSFEEGFGIPVLEAMTLGVPVVASRRGAIPEVLGDAGLFADPQDSSDIAAALRRLLGDEALIQHCREAGLDRSRQFRWSDSATRVLDAYHRAIAHHAARSAAPV